MMSEYSRTMEKAEKVFGIKYLMPWQRLVIANIIDSIELNNSEVTQTSAPDYDDGVNRGKQIILFPTGSGKSMCFLAPALTMSGPTLIIYPLTALINDQMRKIKEKGLECAVFKGGQSKSEREENFQKLRKGAKFILSNPETLQDTRLLERIKEFKVSHIAVDEAHCVCEWGDTFRPAYLTVGNIIKFLGTETVTAFTATAGKTVLERINEVLFNKTAHIIQSPADRENIHYSVIYAAAKEKALIRLCLSERRPLIIFCATRNKAEMTARTLDSYFRNGNTRFYHAGLTKEEKENVEKWFFKSTDGILCATCAYGMGMDKSDIFTVIHLDPPVHPENFIQEAGRAGRKGDNVRSVLIWNKNDETAFLTNENDERKKVMTDYALAGKCRRQILMSYISTEQPHCSGCDICDAKSENKVFSAQERDSAAVLEFIRRNRLLYTKNQIMNILAKDFNRKDLNLFRQNLWEVSDIEEIIDRLIYDKKVKTAGKLWKNRLYAVSEKSQNIKGIVRNV